MIKWLLAGKNGNIAVVKNGNLHVSVADQTIYEPKNIFLVDDAGSPFMNVNGAASGATEGIHDGTDSVLWTASAAAGTWDFASTAQAAAGTRSIDATAVSNGDQAILTRGSAVAIGDYSVITLQIYLTAYNAAKNSINLTWRLAGVTNGSTVDIGDYIDTAIIGAWQSFQIPVGDFGSPGSNDELVIDISATGTPPAFYLDEVDLRAGGGLRYKTNLSVGQKFEYKVLDLFIADAYTGITTVAGATENATMHNLSYDALLGETGLTNGFTFQRLVFDEVVTSGSVRQLSDILQGGFRIISSISDGTNTFLHLKYEFLDWVRLDESMGDSLQVIVNDDLTGLLDLKVLAIGREPL